MRGFLILGALTSLARGAEFPATPDGTIRDKTYLYDAAQASDPDLAAMIPSAWGDDCQASKQSPIDIVSTSVVVESVDPGAINMTGYDIELTGEVITDGRQIVFNPTAPVFKPSIMGGALSSSKNYVFDHIEFKFGTDDTKGSEHTMDGTSYPMEIQLVHYDASLTETDAAASTSADTIVVVSFFVETTATSDNTALADILVAVKDATFAAADDVANSAVGLPVAISKKVTLKDLIGVDQLTQYYYYAGSMTSPPCTENVKWIIANDKIKITENDRKAFSDVLAVVGLTVKVAPNNRPTQTNSNSVMKREDTSTLKSEIYKEAATILGSTLLGIGTFGTVLNILNNDATSKALKSNPLLDLIEDFDEKFLSEGEQQPAQQQFQPQQFQQRY